MPSLSLVGSAPPERGSEEPSQTHPTAQTGHPGMTDGSLSNDREQQLHQSAAAHVTYRHPYLSTGIARRRRGPTGRADESALEALTRQQLEAEHPEAPNVDRLGVARSLRQHLGRDVLGSSAERRPHVVAGGERWHAPAEVGELHRPGGTEEQVLRLGGRAGKDVRAKGIRAHAPLHLHTYEGQLTRRPTTWLPLPQQDQGRVSPRRGCMGDTASPDILGIRSRHGGGVMLHRGGSNNPWGCDALPV